MKFMVKETKERMPVSREIKFRYVCKNIHFQEIHLVYMTLDEIFRHEKLLSWILTDNCEILAKQQCLEVKDCNAKEVYEGDIVKWGHKTAWSQENPHRIAIVKFCPDIEFHSQVGVFKFGAFAYADSIEEDVEIIGNIFETPELIPKVKQ